MSTRLAKLALMFGNFVIGVAILAPAGMLPELSRGLAVTIREAARKLGQHPGWRQDAGDPDHEIPKHQGELGEPCAHDDLLQPPRGAWTKAVVARRVVLTHEQHNSAEKPLVFAVATA